LDTNDEDNTKETSLHWPNAEIIKNVSLTAKIQHSFFSKGTLLEVSAISVRKQLNLPLQINVSNEHQVNAKFMTF